MSYIKDITLVFFAVFLMACVNTKVIYESEDIPPKPTKIGFSQFSQEEVNKYKGKRSVRAFDSTMTTILTEYQIACTKVYITDFRELSDVSPDMIRRMCEKNSLDGLIITQLKLEAVHNASHNSAHTYIGTSMESDIEMQYFNREGELIIHTQAMSSSAGGYGLQEKGYISVSSATQGALSKILKPYEDSE